MRAKVGFHSRVASWLVGLRDPVLATCAITELGFVRVLAQAPAYGLTVAQAREILSRLKRQTAPRFDFLSDDQDLSRLSAWVRAVRQLTDGHLLQLARAHGAVLATLDRGIPGALVIPPNGSAVARASAQCTASLRTAFGLPLENAAGQTPPEVDPLLKDPAAGAGAED